MQPAIQPYLQDILPETIELLRQMVMINSFTANAAGVNAVGDLTAAAFEALGFSAERAPSQNPAYGDHLVLTRAGSSGRKLGLISHLDTVFPPEEEAANDFHWRVVGDRIYGPGTNDVKGGTAMIYLVLRALQQFEPELFNSVTWVILLNASEEVLSDDFGALCRQRLTPGGVAALVFEAGKWNGQGFYLVTSRKGMANYRVAVTGKSAHSGSSHSAGSNAIVQLARTVDAIAALTDYRRDLTFNVGVISGGVVTNRVPHFAFAEGEMRTFETAVYDQAIEALLALQNQVSVASANGYACKIEIEIARKTQPWPVNPGTQKLFAIWERAGAALGFAVKPEARGGLSDGNLIFESLPTIDGLGPHGENGHCSERAADGSKDQEFVSIASFVPKAALNMTAITRLIESI